MVYIIIIVVLILILFLIYNYLVGLNFPNKPLNVAEVKLPSFSNSKPLFIHTP